MASERGCSPNQALSPDTEVEVMGLSTEGDRRQDVSLSTLGGKGVRQRA